MVEPITKENGAEATSALLHTAMFYRGIVNRLCENHAEIVAEVMNEEGDEERWNMAELGDVVIKEWCDFFEIRE